MWRVFLYYGGRTTEHIRCFGKDVWEYLTIQVSVVYPNKTKHFEKSPVSGWSENSWCWPATETAAEMAVSPNRSWIEIQYWTWRSLFSAADEKKLAGVNPLADSRWLIFCCHWLIILYKSIWARKAQVKYQRDPKGADSGGTRRKIRAATEHGYHHELSDFCHVKELCQVIWIWICLFCSRKYSWLNVKWTKDLCEI